MAHPVNKSEKILCKVKLVRYDIFVPLLTSYIDFSLLRTKDGVGGGGGGGGGGDGGFKWGKNISSETRIIGRLIGGLLVLALICIQV